MPLKHPLNPAILLISILVIVSTSRSTNPLDTPRKLDETSTPGDIKCNPTCIQSPPPQEYSPPPPLCPPPPPTEYSPPPPQYVPPPPSPSHKKPPKGYYYPPPPPSSFTYITGPPGELYPIDRSSSPRKNSGLGILVFVGYVLLS